MTVEIGMEKYLFRARIEFSQHIRRMLDSEIQAICTPKGNWPGVEIQKLMEGEVLRDRILVNAMYDISAVRRNDSVKYDGVIASQIMKNRYIIIDYHTHPGTSAKPSWPDIASFFNFELEAGHKMVHVIESSSGEITAWDISDCVKPSFYQLKKDFGYG